MSKIVHVLVALALLFCVSMAECPFSARINVTWDTFRSGWIINDEFTPDLISVAAGKIILFNVTSGSGSFYISPEPCTKTVQYALTRKDGVTNNACVPPCTIAANFTSASYYYCSTFPPNTRSGIIRAVKCPILLSHVCDQYLGCGMSEEDSKCKPCIDAKTRRECAKISTCAWCESDDLCLDVNGGACRALIEYDRAVPSWVWLLITLCALLILVAVFVTLFLAEFSFQSRWASIAKTDKDFAEIGKGAADGLGATD